MISRVLSQDFPACELEETLPDFLEAVVQPTRVLSKRFFTKPLDVFDFDFDDLETDPTPKHLRFL